MCTVCQYHSLVNYAVVQLRQKRTLVHWSILDPDLLSALPMNNFSFSVRHLFQFRFSPHRRNCHVILRQCARFHQYRITHGGDLTSNRFSRWGRCGTVLLPYRTGWRHFLQKVNIYQRTKYRQDNSIHGPDITISVFAKTIIRHIEILFPVSTLTTSP